MARTTEEIEADLRKVRKAIEAMLCVDQSSVGLRNVVDLGGRIEQGMRPTFEQLQQREKDLLAELAQSSAHRRMIFRTSQSKGL